MNEIIEENRSEYELEKLVDTLSTFIEQGTDTAMDILSSDEVSIVWETITELSAEVVKASKFFMLIKKAASIPDKMLAYKIEKYLQGTATIPVKKRKDYVEKVGKKHLNEDSVFLLGILNKIEELSKINMFLKLFELKLDEKIDDKAYRRFMIMVERTMYSDLEYLLANITDNNIVIEHDAEHGLLVNGWLNYIGQSIGTEEEESQHIYNYSSVAKHFCELMNVNLQITDKNEN